MRQIILQQPQFGSLMKRAASGLAWTASSFALAALGCSSRTEQTNVDQRGLDIIGGLHADSPELNHTGALVLIDPTTNTSLPFCSSTLISPETVVTAKHCAVVFPQIESAGFKLAWAAGPHANTPLELIPVVAADSSPGDVGGFVGMGRDVAVAYLDHPTTIPPAVPKPASEAAVGRSMVSIGYGVFSAGGTSDDQRRIGRETVAAQSGKVFEVMFGSFENFVEWAFTGQVTDEDFLASVAPDDPFLAQLRVLFDTQLLFDQHEAVTGLASPDTQSCFGDSGGPLAAFNAGHWETYGVVSGGLFSLRSACDFGTVFSTFGPDSLAFLQKAVTWTDPCADVTAQGQCDGNLATRCETSLVAGIRRLKSEDCAAQGLTCIASDTGVGCGVVTEPVPAQPPEPGAKEKLLQLMQDSFHPEIERTLNWKARSPQ
jgi:hypothetical protein